MGKTKSGRSTGINFTTCDVKRPLAAVVDMCDQGKRVVFDNDGSYIEDKKTGMREEITGREEL